MATIFISHSRKDEELVRAVKKALENVGHTPVIEELIPTEEQEAVPYEEIQTNVKESEFLFLFLTDNVVATEFTQNWVCHEAGLAAAYSKRLFVFERAGTPIKFPIPYLTDYALFDPEDPEDILGLQNLAKDLGKLRRDLLTAGGGAALGATLGPVGMVLGAVGGYLIGPKPPKPLTVKCDHCNVGFNYYSIEKAFRCPSCRRDIVLG